MSNNHISTFNKGYGGQRIFNSKEDGYTFDILSDKWELDYKKNLNLTWMNELDTETFLDLRLAIAHAAKRYAFTTTYTIVCTLKSIVSYLDAYKFQAWWLTLDTYKKKVRECLSSLCNPKSRYISSTLKPLYDSVKDDKLGQKNAHLKGILDPKTGAYSEVEQDNILESLRIETLHSLNKEVLSIHAFTRSRNIIASQLILILVRRPSQLLQIKWCDILPVGQIFQSHKESDCNWKPVTQHIFSDVEQLHVRTFRGKDGQFRDNAESRSHRLETDFSQLLVRYYQSYENYLLQSLSAQDILLIDDEAKEIMSRLPVLPDKSLFSSEFESKSELFSSVSHTSKAYHISSSSLNTNIRNLFKKLKPSSDRLPNDTLMLQNNRWRHTILTQGAKYGLSPAHLAAITGVTTEAIKPYLDLKASERVKIDEAYAGNNIIKRFDSLSVKELQTHDDFKVKSMFDEEIGHKLNPANCVSCRSKGGAPMACYPCDNFRPLETANHHQYLDKAERKLAINSQSAHPATVKRLKKVILYIKMTITLCEERKTARVGGVK
ncbi:hypothetical protein AB4277_01865 [Vibrio splendidus]|uniref:hypothetical protein n=1 Tax=Vibrio sp. 1-2 (7-a) TaxID=2591010 RepID=UPI0014834675|nr:hypothetical protein [Vibrio sp. 1-2 (7-a)]NNN56616.1 hypothetical protein [Vibrio sp. 1-2 (7-a)]